MAKAKLPVKKKRATKKPATKKPAAKKPAAKKPAAKKPAAKTTEMKIVNPPSNKKASRVDKKLKRSREAQEKTLSDRMGDKIGDLQAALEQSQQREKKLQVLLNEQSQTIKGLRKFIEEQKSKLNKQSKQIPAKKLQPWMVQKSSIEIAGNMFQICKKMTTDENPGRYFPVGEILEGEIDTDATVEDIKEYVRNEHGKGDYKIKAFNEDLGHKVLRGSVRFQV